MNQDDLRSALVAGVDRATLYLSPDPSWAAVDGYGLDRIAEALAALIRENLPRLIAAGRVSGR